MASPRFLGLAVPSLDGVASTLLMPWRARKRVKKAMKTTTGPNISRRHLLLATILLLAHAVGGFENVRLSRVAPRPERFGLGGVRDQTASANPSVASLVQDATTVDGLLRAAQGLVPPGEETVHWQHQEHHQRKRQVVGGRLLSKLAKLAVGIENEPARRHIAASPEFLRCLQCLDICDVHDRSHGTGKQPESEGRSLDHEPTLRSTLYALAVLVPTTTTTADSSPVSTEASSSRELLEGVVALREKASDLAHRLSALHRTATSAVSFAGSFTLSPEEHEVAWACQRLGIGGFDFSAPRGPVGGGGEEAFGAATTSSETRAETNLPFQVIPGHALGANTPRPMTVGAGFSAAAGLGCHVCVAELEAEVPFQEEVLVTREGKAVTERRATCWMADEGVGGFAYSGKVMSPVPWSPAVRRLRDALAAAPPSPLNPGGGKYYDCALINWYGRHGESACAWHADPEVGTFWHADSTIVSVGETRRFAFREKPRATPASSRSTTPAANTYQFHVFDGCCVRMFGDCQEKFEHCVLPAEGARGAERGNCGPRASVVFKSSLLLSSGRRGHGVPSPSERSSRPPSSLGSADAPPRGGGLKTRGAPGRKRNPRPSNKQQTGDAKKSPARRGPKRKRGSKG